MDRKKIFDLMKEVFHASENTVHLPDENKDVTILEEPIMGIAKADDPLFLEMKNEEVIGENWLSPEEWLPGAKSVIVFFFPYSEEIRRRHRESEELVDEAWKYGYPAGSTLSKDMTTVLLEKLKKEGLTVLDPLKDPRMNVKNIEVRNGEEEDLHFIPAWSTRHAGYVAGLGTFGIHRHIITRKGCCGSLTTIITAEELETDDRDYTGPYDYCSRCGQCAEKCPAGAITLENLRNLKKCSAHGGYLRETVGGGGCSKCMMGVPCEFGIPGR